MVGWLNAPALIGIPRVRLVIVSRCACVFVGVRRAVTSVVAERQRVLREWVEAAIAIGGTSIALLPKTVAALLPATSDSLVPRYAVDPHAFRQEKISKAVDGMLD